MWFIEAGERFLQITHRELEFSTASKLDAISRREKELQLINHYDWEKKLKSKSSSDIVLSSACILMRSFCEGVVNTIRDQECRNLTSLGFRIPTVTVTRIPFRAQYSQTHHQVQVNIADLQFASLQFAKYQKPKILSGQRLKYNGSYIDLYYLLGCHEAKHSVDSTAGRTSKYDGRLIDMKYDAQLTEYLAIGQEVLMEKKRSPDSDSYRTIMTFLQEIIAYRRQSRS